MTVGPTLNMYVSLSGNDAWSGLVAAPNADRTDGPVRTVEAAQTLARQRLTAMLAGATRQPITVRIAAGEYRLNAPLTFTPADSGAQGAPVIYRAETYGTVTFSGAVQVGTAAPSVVGTMITLPSPAIDASNQRGGAQLFVNGRRATLARSPNAGAYWFVQRAAPLSSEPTGQTGMEAFGPPTDALAMVNSLSTADRSRAIVHIMQSWASGSHRLSSEVTPAGTVRVTPRTPYPFLDFGTDQRFFVENVASALDAPGEWLLDANSLRYITSAADAGQTLKFEMPQLERLLVVKGNAAADAWVQDLQFLGLNFANTRQLTPDGGQVDSQAGNAIGAAIEVDSARRIVINSSSVIRTGGYGIWLRASVRDSRVSNNYLTDLGAGGVKIGLTKQSMTDPKGTAFNTVYTNRITETGKLIPGAVGVWIGQSSNNTVSNNLIANTSYSGISVGWSWTYGSGATTRNSIVNNLLINIGLGQLSDMGGIYTAGESSGTVISGNVIHEVRPFPNYGAGAWGLYNDAAAQGVLWERNIVVGTQDGGYLLNYGRSNTLRNNLLAYGDTGEVRVTRSDPTLTNLVFSNNLLLPKNTSPFVSFATAPDVVFSGNQVSNRVLSTAVDMTKCGTGCTLSSAVLTVGSDPRVITLAGADVATSTWVTQVAAASGPINLAPSLIPAVNASLPVVYVAPPVGYVAEIAETAIGGRPLNLKYFTNRLMDPVTVQADTGTPSGKCLRLMESTGIVNAWEPTAYATLNHTADVTTAEFSVKIDAATNFWHEWRDNANKYLTGPSLRIKPTGIEVAGKVVAPAPVGTWINVKITAPLGSTAGLWTLAVSNGTATPMVVGTYPNQSAGWNRLNWLGFMANGTAASSTCLGYIKAINTGS